MLSLLRKHWIVPVVCLLLLVAGFMRLYDANFDQGTNQHPDERTMIDRAMNHVNLPPGMPLSQLLDPATSPLNPRLGTHYPYGALPLYLARIVSAAGAAWFNKVSWLDYNGFQLLGRTLSGIFDLITVFLVFLIARRLYGRWAALLAMAFSAFCVMQIQIAHFFIVEPYLVTFLTAALYFSVILMQTRRAWAAALAGLMLGLALACKVSVVAVAVLIVAAVALRVVYRTRTRQLGPPANLDDPYGLEPASRVERTSTTRSAATRAFLLLVLAGVMTAVGFAVGDPFGLFDSGLHVTLSSDLAGVTGGMVNVGPLHFYADSNKYFDQLLQEAAVQSGNADVPYTAQFVGDLPVLYNVWQLVQFGMGFASGVTAILGLLLAIWLAFRRRAAEILLLSGIIPYFLTIVTLEAKWPRYVLPLVPYLCILGGALLARGFQWSAAVAPRIAAWRARRIAAPAGLILRRWSFPVIAGVAVLCSALWATAFMNIYTHEESRVVASHWMARNIPPSASIGHETWDDALPIGLPGDPGGGWQGVDMGIYDFRPGPDEFTYIAGLLQQADYIVPASNRIYGSIIHEPWRYPVQMKYYELLFDGKLGFEQVLPAADQKIYPEIFGIQINDDSADESFTVYDHPHVYVFKKVRSLSTDELRTLFGSSINAPSVNLRHLQIHAAGDYDKSLMMSQAPGQQLAVDDYSWNPLAQNQWVAVLFWVLAIEVLGLLAWPLTALVCRRLPDRGYPVSKIIGLLVVSWLVWMVASLGWIPFTVYSILGAIVVLAAISAVIWRRFGPELRAWWRAHRSMVLGWEALFLVAFAAFLVIRMLDPDLWQPWNGGEKPMEFGFLNSILRSPWMPPGDPFFSGGYINYYYYGWVTLGVLIKLLGIDPAIGFNLSIPLLFALSILGGGSLVYNCVASVQRARGWRVAVSRTAFGWAVVGACLLAVIGNLTFLLQFISMKFPGLQNAFVQFMSQFGRVGDDITHSFAGGFDYWGGATRVIPFTINEWPFWTFLFADLHPHMIDISFTLLSLGLIFNLLLGAWRWPVFRCLSADVLDAPVPVVPAVGVLARSVEHPFWQATLEATQRLWGSSWLEAGLRFAVTALAVGTLYAVNSWDFPVALLVALGAFFVAVLGAYQGHAVRRGIIRLAVAASAVISLGLLAVMGLVFYAPFLATFKPFYNQIKLISADQPKSDLGSFLTVWGLFIFIGFSYLALQLWKYPWAETLRGFRELAGGRPRLTPAPALAAPTPAASTAAPLDLALARFTRPADAPVVAQAPALVVAEAPETNGHVEVAPVPAALTVPAPPHEEWDEYALGDVGSLGLELDEADLARQRRSRTALVEDAGYGNGHGGGDLPDEPEENGHGGAMGDYQALDMHLPQHASVPAEASTYEATVPVAGNGAPGESTADLSNGAAHVEATANGTEPEGAPLEAPMNDALVAEAPTNGHAHEAPADGSITVEPADAFMAEEHPSNGAAALAAPEAELVGDARPANGAADTVELGSAVEDAGPVVDEAAAAEADAVGVPLVARPRLRGLLWPAVGVGIMAVTAAVGLGFLLTHQWLELVLTLLIGGLIATHLGAVRNPGQLFGGLLLAVSWAIALGVEFVYLADHLQGDTQGWYRMNTVFKFYEQVWILVACGSAVALYMLLGPRGRNMMRSIAGPGTPTAPPTADLYEPAPGATDDNSQWAKAVADETAPVALSEATADETAPMALSEANTDDSAVPLEALASADEPAQESAPPVVVRAAEAPAPEPVITAEPVAAEFVMPAETIGWGDAPAEEAAPSTTLAATESTAGEVTMPVEMAAPDVPPADTAPLDSPVVAETTTAEGDAPLETMAAATEGEAPAEMTPVVGGEAQQDEGVALAAPIRPRRRVIAGPELADARAATSAPPPATILPVAEAQPAVEAEPAANRSWLSLPRVVWLVPLVFLILGSLIFTVAGTQARVADRFPGDQPPVGTLNGMDWMNVTVLTLAFDNNATSGPVNYKFEREALDWVNTHIKGTPVFAAAPREYYRESGMMISTYTGLPMVVGGLHQDEQRYGWEVGDRRGDMQNFYTSADVQQALLLIDKYDIQYIYLGQIETMGYQKNPDGLAKFQTMVDDKYLEVAYHNQLVTIYHVLPQKVLADIGVAPGSAPRPQPTPAPKPTEPPLGDDPVLNGLLASVQASPNSVDAHRALGEYYRQHGALEKAITEYTTVVQLTPQDVPAHHILGDLYVQEGDPDKALAAWEDAVKNARDADKPAAYNKVGIAYQERQRFDDAVNAFKGAVQADPSFAEGWFHLGETYVSMQNIDAARDAFQNCIKNAKSDESGQNWKREAQKRLDSLP